MRRPSEARRPLVIVSRLMPHQMSVGTASDRVWWRNDRAWRNHLRRVVPCLAPTRLQHLHPPIQYQKRPSTSIICPLESIFLWKVVRSETQEAVVRAIEPHWSLSTVDHRSSRHSNLLKKPSPNRYKPSPRLKRALNSHINHHQCQGLPAHDRNLSSSTDADLPARLDLECRCCRNYERTETEVILPVCLRSMRLLPK